MLPCFSLRPLTQPTVSLPQESLDRNSDAASVVWKFITRIKPESEARASHEVARRNVLIANELGYEMIL